MSHNRDIASVPTSCASKPNEAGNAAAHDGMEQPRYSYVRAIAYARWFGLPTEFPL